MAKIIRAQEAAAQIPDGASVAVVGMGLAGWPDEVAQAIAERYKASGHPRGLSLRQGSAIGDFRERGTTRLGIEGLVTRWSGAHVGAAKNLGRLAAENKLQCHCLPQGVIVNLWREIAAGRPGLITKIGLNTFVDPRYGGGRMNEAATDELVSLIELGGEEYLFYKSFKLDVALIRGTCADEDGNISFDKEPMLAEGLAAASAAKNSGGIVIVQVEYLAERGSLRPKDIRIPGVLVDYVVLASDEAACWQSPSEHYDPSLSGQIRKPLRTVAPLPLDERKVIARRCAAELRKGDLINLGMGIPVAVAKVVAEEGRLRDICLSTESGIFGGVPSERPSTTINPDSFIDHGAMFDIIDGGGLDVTCLGMGELDELGNVNVSKLGSQLVGPGGFIDLTQSTRKVIFCGTFMGHAQLRIGDGRLTVEREGNIRKLVKSVGQITFNGGCTGPDQEVLYITERCVLRMLGGRLTVTEIAPGIDLQRDILSQMDFEPAVSDELKLMDPGLFCEHWSGLESTLGNQDQEEQA